jgi:hypothetical protein
MRTEPADAAPAVAEQKKPAEQEQKKPKPSVRKQRQLMRMAMVKQGKEVARVRIAPCNETARANIKHPRAGAFRSTGNNEWPDDTFTRRRIREGTVKLEAARDRSQEKPTEKTTTAAPEAAPSAA